MEDILEQFFYHGIYPEEQPMPKTQEYSQVIAETDRLERALKETLPETDFVLFEQYKYQRTRLENMTEASRFTHGWKMGAKFTLATFLDE